MDDYTKHDCEINYKEMYEQAMTLLHNSFELQKTFFDLQSRLLELSPYMTAAGEHALDMDMIDAVRYLKTIVNAGEIAKEICDKYGWAEDKL